MSVFTATTKTNSNSDINNYHLSLMIKKLTNYDTWYVKIINRPDYFLLSHLTREMVKGKFSLDTF